MRPAGMVILATIAALTVPGPVATANPIPVPQGGGDPAPSDSLLDIIFWSENVVYTVDNEVEAGVSALYALSNPNDRPVSANISLPFDSNVPKDLRLAANGNAVVFEAVERDAMRYEQYAYARFRLDFSACETQNIRAVYSVGYSVYSDWSGPFTLGTGKLSLRHSWCRYIAETGRHWNNSLDSAVFQFRIKKDLYGSGLDGFAITHEDGYVVATQTYYGWRPTENIDARWERPDVGMTVLEHWCPILVTAWVISVVLVGIAFRRRRRNREALRAWRGP